MKIDKGIMIENQKLIFDLNKYENLITKLKNVRYRRKKQRSFKRKKYGRK